MNSRPGRSRTSPTPTTSQRALPESSKCDGKIDRYDADKRYRRKDGTIVWARLTVSCVRKNAGSIDYLVTVVEDISARKYAEEELRKSEERFRSSLLHSPLPVLMYDDREQILAVS